MQVNGIITKGVGGLYFIKTEDKIVKAKARGKFRRDSVVPMVGDHVRVLVEKGEARIDHIYDRKNQLVRPPVSNIDQLCIVTAVTSPMPDLYLLDKLTVSALYQHIHIIFCINKIDLEDPAPLADIYQQAGFCVKKTCTKEGTGIEELKDSLQKSVTAFCGASGVGKSSLLNALNGHLGVETSQVSQKIQRGRNTTRHSEIFEIAPDTYVFDTPGFSSFDVPEITARDLIQYFPDLSSYVDCQYKDCAHVKEENCGVLAALSDGKIASSRHESYVKMYEECKNIKEWEKR